MTSLEKLKRKFEEAKQTVLIANDIKARYDLSLIVLALKDLGELDEAEIMEIRQKYNLTSLPWMVAESAHMINTKEN